MNDGSIAQSSFEVFKEVPIPNNEGVVANKNNVSFVSDRPRGNFLYWEQAISPMSWNFFELEVLNVSRDEQILVGLVLNGAMLNSPAILGSSRESLGYNLATGVLTHEGKSENYGPRLANGDSLGIGVLPGQDGSVEVFFSMNGMVFGNRNIVLEGESFVPAVSLANPGERIIFKKLTRWIPKRRNLPEHEEMQCDTFGDSWDRLRIVHLNGDIMSGNTHSNGPIRRIGFAQASKALSTLSHYFEAEILDLGRNCFIGVGVAHKGHNAERELSYAGGSIGFHANTGEMKIVRSSEAFLKGDKIGCGILFPPERENSTYTRVVERKNETDSYDDDDEEESDGEVQTSNASYKFLRRFGTSGRNFPSRLGSQPLFRSKHLRRRPLYAMASIEKDEYSPSEQLDSGKKVEVFYTKNGRVVAKNKMPLPPDGFFPTISMKGDEVKVRINLHPFSG